MIYATANFNFPFAALGGISEGEFTFERRFGSDEGRFGNDEEEARYCPTRNLLNN